MKNETKNLRTDALPHDGKTWADALIDGNDITNAILAGNGIDLCTDDTYVDAVRDVIEILVDAGFEHYFANANVKQFFIYTEDTRDRVSSLDGTDGVCYWVHKVNPCCIIGICTRAIDQDRDYMLGVILHEIAHGMLRWEESEHGFAFYVLLDALASQVNDRLGVVVHPDYNDVEAKDAGRIMYGASRNNTDGVDRELETIRNRHNKRTGGK